jgi:WD40 repeat protein
MPTPRLKRFRLALPVALAASLAIAGVFVVRKVRAEPTANWVRTINVQGTEVGSQDKAAALDWGPDGRLILVRYRSARLMASYDHTTGQRIGVEDRPLRDSFSVASPDGLLRASDGRLYSASTGEKIRPLAARNDKLVFSQAIDWAPDGKVILRGTGQGTVEANDPATGAAEGAPWVDEEDAEVEAVAFSPDGARFATTGLGKLRIYDSRTHALLRTMHNLGNGPDQYWGAAKLSWSPDARTIALSAEGIRPTVIDTSSGKVVCKIPTARHSVSLAWSPDGSLLATGFHLKVDLWNSCIRS